MSERLVSVQISKRVNLAHSHHIQLRKRRRKKDKQKVRRSQKEGRRVKGKYTEEREEGETERE
jgi:hypothetical protein